MAQAALIPPPSRLIWREGSGWTRPFKPPNNTSPTPSQIAQKPPDTMSSPIDIAIVGAGAAGIAAAVSAARTGRTALLLDHREAAGGTGGYSGLTTLCGLYNDRGNFLNEGFPREFAKLLSEAQPVRMGRVWVLPYRPERFREIAANLLGRSPTMQTRWSTQLAGVERKGDRIVRVNGMSVRAVIDCTGNAEVARVVGAPSLATDETTQAPAVVFPLQNVQRDLKSLADAAQVLLPLARAGFPPLSFQPAVESKTITIKFSGHPDRAEQLIAFLRSHVPGFENCVCPTKEFTLSRRAGRMIVGRYLLTGADVLSGRQFPDAVARCAWPIEQWSADGFVKMRYLPEGAHYEIPARSLQAAGIQNLFMAGKTISADADAIASARVMGCCLATGEAAAKLAANWLQTNR
jgi:hypothetical protein